MLLEVHKQALEEIITSEGYSLYSLKVNENKKDVTLAIVIDRETPISLEDLEKISGLLSSKLDELDPFEGAYMLDVSSLGVEKPIDIANIEKEVGQYVYLHLSHPYQGLNSLEGHLKATDKEGYIILLYKEKNRQKEALIKISDIDRAHRAVEL